MFELETAYSSIQAFPATDSKSAGLTTSNRTVRCTVTRVSSLAEPEAGPTA